VPILASGADFRLMSRKVLDALLRCRETHRLMRGLVGWLGFPSVVVKFRPAARAHGATKYSWSRLLTLASDSFLSFSRLPLRLAFGLGTLFLVLAPVLLLGGLIHSGIWGDTGWGLLVLLAALAAMNGCVLLVLGIVGEYVGRIYEQVKGRPLYLLKETSEDRPPGRLSRPEEAA
jgi:dolichol-phosphate mannosyltransferase